MSRARWALRGATWANRSPTRRSVLGASEAAGGTTSTGYVLPRHQWSDRPRAHLRRRAGLQNLATPRPLRESRRRCGSSVRGGRGAKDFCGGHESALCDPQGDHAPVRAHPIRGHRRPRERWWLLFVAGEPRPRARHGVIDEAHAPATLRGWGVLPKAGLLLGGDGQQRAELRSARTHARNRHADAGDACRAKLVAEVTSARAESGAAELVRFRKNCTPTAARQIWLHQAV